MTVFGLYTGGSPCTTIGGVAQNRCQMGHSELQKIDQTVKKPSEIRGTVARNLNFLVTEIHSTCHGANPNIGKSNKKLQMPFRISNIFFSLGFFHLKGLCSALINNTISKRLF